MEDGTVYIILGYIIVILMGLVFSKIRNEDSKAFQFRLIFTLFIYTIIWLLLS